MSDEIDEFDPERFRLKAYPSPLRPKPVRRPAFARTWLLGLTSREWDELFPPRIRLWLFLLIKSKEGRCSVRLSNELAKEIGFDRFVKRRSLAWLERAGLVTVTQSGKESPIVTVFPDAVCGLRRNRVWSQTQQGVVSNAHQSPPRNSTSLSTSLSFNESNKEPTMGATKDAQLEEHATFNTPAQPLTPRLPIPPKTLDAVFDRSGGGCEQCGSDRPLELHHLHYNTQGRERPEDLRALCRECHESRHRDTLGMFWVDPVELRHVWGVDPPPDGWNPELDDIPGWRG